MPLSVETVRFGPGQSYQGLLVLPPHPESARPVPAVLLIQERDRHRLKARVRVAGGSRHRTERDRDDRECDDDAAQWMYAQMTQP